MIKSIYLCVTKQKEHFMTDLKIEYSTKQLLRVSNMGEATYEIGAVTEKAIMIKGDDGRYGGDGFKAIWIPKSIIDYRYYNDKSANSSFGIHGVNLPEWFINQNSKRL